MQKRETTSRKKEKCRRSKNGKFLRKSINTKKTFIYSQNHCNKSPLTPLSPSTLPHPFWYCHFHFQFSHFKKNL